MTSNPLPPAKRMPGSVGIGQGVQVRILDQAGKEVPRGSEAEICIRGENVTAGYLNNPEANKSSFTDDGFFRTGDQGKQDADGYVIITGRIKELINKGGEKISPIELDNVVAQHPAVAEVVSFAVSDELYGQDVGIAVVLKDSQDLGSEELKKWMTERVAKFKLPKKVLSPLHKMVVKQFRLIRFRSTSQRRCPKQPQGRYNAGWLLRKCRSRIRRGRSCSISRNIYPDQDEEGTAVTQLLPIDIWLICRIPCRREPYVREGFRGIA